jgi:hypothetical protein
MSIQVFCCRFPAKEVEGAKAVSPSAVDCRNSLLLVWFIGNSILLKFHPHKARLSAFQLGEE